MAATTLPDEPPTQEPAEPDYREVRRWCIAEARPLGPADLQRRFRIDYYKAAGLLEELEKDRVLEALPTGERICRAPKDAGCAPQRSCEACGWFIPRRPNLSARDGGVHSHHIVPRCRGGGDVPENLIDLCPNCHAMAHALFPVPRKHRPWLGPTSRNELLAALRELRGEPPKASSSRWADLSVKTPKQERGISWVRRSTVAEHLREQHGGAVHTCAICYNRAPVSRFYGSGR